MEGKWQVHERITRLSQTASHQVLHDIGTPETGLTSAMAEHNREAFGSNRTSDQNRDSVIYRLRRAFVNPFSIVLFLLAVIAVMTDLLLEKELRHNQTTVAIIAFMLMLSGVVRFIQELRAKKVTDHLSGLLHTTVTLCRNGVWQQAASSELVVGDLVRLRAGDRIPADIRLLSAEDCFVSQAMITGESGVQEKTASELEQVPEAIGDYHNIVFMGSTLSGGTCSGVVAAVGRDTAYGVCANDIPSRKTGFDRGANSIAWVLIRFMILLVPVVFIASGITHGEWLTAFLFSLSVAVGLTPELLPMVITACMARGSSCMGRKQTVVKNINAMQGFGSMDILCVDKTGTLTGDKVFLEYYMDILGNESENVLDCAFLNSCFQTGVENHLDTAIRDVRHMPGHEAHFAHLEAQWRKLDELPFDYQRKSVGILLENGAERCLLVKGDVDSVVSRCSRAEYRGELLEIGPDAMASVHHIIDEMTEDGMKVLAVAVKRMTRDYLKPGDETELILLGYLAFFDAPRRSASSAIRKLKELQIGVKVLTGDHAGVARSVCRRLDIPVDRIVTGSQLEDLSDDETQMIVEKTDVFAELTPRQKAQIIEILQSNGHSVGFLGDGMNDLPAELQADVGISVDTACEAVKEAADVILLKKDLNVLEEGVIEGRKAFANMTKYIKITASSNFGNICAIVAASICLPFFPMTSLQLLLLNLLYDILCLVLPWDRVDEDLCRKPLDWSGRTLPRFMLSFGIVSTLFDLLTFLFLYGFLCPALCGGGYWSLNPAQQAHFVSLFQTGWFLESMWTQVLILHLLRTGHLPFIQSQPSGPVLAVTLVGILSFTVLTMTPVGSALGMSDLPLSYFIFLGGSVVSYLLAVTGMKRLYQNRYGDLL